MNIPIVIAAYNREQPLKRLLASLEQAYYPKPVKLIVSIDGGGPDSVTQIVGEYAWRHGTKEIITHQENLGLRRHILSCGAISSQYDGVILLEDDIFVSPWFYHYAIAALDYYKECKDVCGVSLYSYQYNETASLPFKPLNDGSDGYFMQLPCSWGQAWLREHWSGFSTWYDVYSDFGLQDQSALPTNISFWPDTSWKKYFLKYMVASDKYFVYPRNSYTTNFGDKGQHHQGTNVFQVPLVCGYTRDYKFNDFDEYAVKYDAFCELLPACLNQLCNLRLPANLSVDLYGSKRRENLGGEYVLTSRQCVSFQESFGRRLVPAEMNIINRIAGEELFLARVEQLADCGDINRLVHDKAGNVAEQRYYFGTDDVHYARLKDVENNSLYNECEARLVAMQNSRSWQITRPLRWLMDRARRLTG